jgi:hypothetical protein
MSSAFLGSRLNQGSSCVRVRCCAEQAGVCAAIDLLDELVTVSHLYILKNDLFTKTGSGQT